MEEAVFFIIYPFAFAPHPPRRSMLAHFSLAPVAAYSTHTHTHIHTKHRVSHSFALNCGACAYILMRDDIL